MDTEAEGPRFILSLFRVNLAYLREVTRLHGRERRRANVFSRLIEIALTAKPKRQSNRGEK
jgi:hypothetical protein